MIGPYKYLLIGLALLAALAAAYAKGRGDGGALEAAHWQAREIEAQQQALHEKAALQGALDARGAELAQRQQEAADAVVQIRTEFLPAKTIVRREVAERVVYRECVVGDRMRDLVNAALRGHPVADAPDDSGSSVVPGGTLTNGR